MALASVFFWTVVELGFQTQYTFGASRAATQMTRPGFGLEQGEAGPRFSVAGSLNGVQDLVPATATAAAGPIIGIPLA